MTTNREQRLWVGLLVLVALAAVALVLAAQAWGSAQVLNIPEATRYGNQTFNAPTGHEGQTCRFVMTQTNNRSIHENTVTLVTNSVTVLDVPAERADSPPSWSTPWVTAGPTVTLNLWAEDVSSTGFTVSIECEVPTSTTTPETTTSTTTPESTTSTTTTSTTVPESSSTTTTTVPTTPTTSTSSPPSPSPSVTVPTSTVPETTPIPSGIPSGSSGPAGPVWPGVLVAALMVPLSGAAMWRLRHDG